MPACVMQHASGLAEGVARNRMRTEAGKMPESLIFPIRNGLGVSNDRFGIKPLDWIMELLWMKKAEYLDGYKLSLVFNDGKRRIFDFSSLLDSDEKSYGPLKDMSVFKSFALDGWTVTWNEGRIDIAPEYLSSMESPHRRASLRFLFVY